MENLLIIDDSSFSWQSLDRKRAAIVFIVLIAFGLMTLAVGSVFSNIGGMVFNALVLELSGEGLENIASHAPHAVVSGRIGGMSTRGARAMYVPVPDAVSVVTTGDSNLVENGLSFGQGDAFDHPDIVEAAVYTTTVLYLHRELPATFFAAPSFVSQVPLDHLWTATQVEFVSWEFGIWQDLVLTTSESEFGQSYTQLTWWVAGQEETMQLPVGNMIRLAACDREVYVRFTENGYPVYLDPVQGKAQVFSLSISLCNGQQTVLQQQHLRDGEAVRVPVGELYVGPTNLLWRHFHVPVGIEAATLQLGEEVQLSDLAGTSGIFQIGLEQDQKILTYTENENSSSVNMVHTNGADLHEIAKGLYVTNNYDGTATIYYDIALWSLAQ